MRHAVPENRVRVYDVRAVVDALADAGSVLELRRGFAAGMVTALVRVEGAVRLGFRKELDAVEDPAEREQLYRKLVASMYEEGRAANTASVFEIDDVIDPAQTRRWIAEGFRSYVPDPGGPKRRPNVDTW